MPHFDPNLISIRYLVVEIWTILWSLQTMYLFSLLLKINISDIWLIPLDHVTNVHINVYMCVIPGYHLWILPCWVSFPMHVKQNHKMSLKPVKFNFYLSDWIAYIICKATFLNRPHWNWSIGYKDTGSWGLRKHKETKKFSASFWFYLKISFVEFRLILLDHIPYAYRVCTMS